MQWKVFTENDVKFIVLKGAVLCFFNRTSITSKNTSHSENIINFYRFPSFLIYFILLRNGFSVFVLRTLLQQNALRKQGRKKKDKIKTNEKPKKKKWKIFLYNPSHPVIKQAILTRKKIFLSFYMNKIL